MKTLISIHGAGLDARIWDALSTHLPSVAARHLNLPGHGGGGTALASVEAMAAWVAERLEAPTVLLGHSMGALAALEAAAHPHVAGLVLMGAAAQMPVHPDLLRCAREDIPAAIGMIAKWGVAAGREDLRPVLESIMQGNAAALHHDLAACNAYNNGVAAAQKCAAPVLVICGEKDKMTRAENGIALARSCPRGKAVTLPATGHMMMLENPAGCAAAIMDFLSGISGG